MNVVSYINRPAPFSVPYDKLVPYLFANGELGGLFDPSDLTTMFQDAAGTTPANQPGHQVRRMNSLAGSVASVLAPTDAARPVLGREPRTGRRNLLLATDILSTQSRTVTAAQHTLSFRGTGTVTLSGASTAGPLVGSGASDIVSLTFTPTAGSLTLTVSGTVEIAQLELGASRSAYQAVTTQWDVTEAGVPDVWYLFFDGVDDLMESTSLAGWGAPFYFGAVVAAQGFDGAVTPTATFGAYTNTTQRADFGMRLSNSGAADRGAATVRQGGGTQHQASTDNGYFIDRLPHLASGGYQAGQVFIEHDGTLRQTTARSITDTFSAPFRIGQGANAPIKFYGGAYVVDELTAAQQMLVKQFYANRMGIAL